MRHKLTRGLLVALAIVALSPAAASARTSEPVPLVESPAPADTELQPVSGFGGPTGMAAPAIPGGPQGEVRLVGGGTLRFQAHNTDRFPFGWCTWYVAARRDVPWQGDAGEWLGAAAAMGFATGSTPRVGAILVTGESGLGHVAYVERVNPDGTFVVSEMNYLQFGEVDFRTLQAGPKVLGFIY